MLIYSSLKVLVFWFFNYVIRRSDNRFVSCYGCLEYVWRIVYDFRIICYIWFFFEFWYVVSIGVCLFEMFFVVFEFLIIVEFNDIGFWLFVLFNYSCRFLFFSV